MATPQFSLDGRVAIVTGASRGIGRAIAIGFAAHGANLVLVSRARESLKAAAGEVQDLGRQSLVVPCDVSKTAEVSSMVERAVASFGKIDILVNCAGISPTFKSAELVTDEEWEEIISVNLSGTFKCCREVGKAMLSQGSGSIINLSSLGGVVAIPKVIVYCTSKGGIEQMTKVLAMDWAQRGVRVNAIIPGWIATDMTARLRETDNMREAVIQRTPLGRIAEPSEVVGAAVYLASDAASFVTGETIRVDGGWLAQGMRWPDDLVFAERISP